MTTKRVGVLLFEDVELLDFAGPVEVLWATRTRAADGRWVPFFDVLLLAERAGPIRTAQGVEVSVPMAVADCPALDVILVPGGWGTRSQMKNQQLLDWLRERSGAAELTTSVCTGSLVLGAAGLLDGRRATTHWESLELLAKSAPRVNVVRDEHVVMDGALLTSAGVSAGIDLALLIVRRYLGEAAARSVARNIEYPYPESNARRT
jgi:transcriptional regulator GlxA family with amidase domain